MNKTHTRRQLLQLGIGSVMVGSSGCVIPGLQRSDKEGYPFTPRPFTEVEGGRSITAVFGGDGYPESFARSVETSGDTIFVGAPDADAGPTNVGAVYVYQRSTGEWTQSGRLVASNGRSGEQFGSQIVASDGKALVKSYSETTPVYVFEQGNEDIWTQQATIDDRQGDLSTAEIALAGDTAILGGSDKVHVFEQTGDEWRERQTLRIDAEKRHIASAAADGTTALLGFTPKGGQTNIGKTYVYELSDGSWAKTATFEGGYRFGGSVAVSGDTAAILDSSNSTVYVLRRSDGHWERHDRFTWTEGELPLSGPSVVALDEQTILVGSRGRDRPGEFHMIDLDDGADSRRGATQASPDGGELFGTDVALADGTAVVADPGKQTVYCYEV